jgi:predicted transcriptional regulator
MGKTIDIIKEKRKAAPHVKELIKEFNKTRKEILKCLEAGAKSIPEIAAETNIEVDVVTYNLMSLLKFGKVVTGELDDNDEYYFYELKK